jgi:phage protein D
MAQARRDEPLVPTFGIELDGKPLVDDLALSIVSVTVEDTLDLPGMFTIELISKEDEEGSTAWTDEPRLALGTAVKISMGYGVDRETLFAGEITSLAPMFSNGGAPTLSVHGFDKRHRLNTIMRQFTYKTDVTDAQIAREICSAKHVNVAIKATETKDKYSSVSQFNQTDLAFLQDRAKRINFELAVDNDGTLHFRPDSSATKSVVSLSLDDDLLEFQPRMTLVPLTGVQALAWDTQQKKPIKASVNAGSQTSMMGGKESAAQHAEKVFVEATESIVGVPASSQAELDRLASAYFNAAALDFIQASGRVRGRTDVRAGRVIHVENIGTRFSGDYQVTSATHHYSRHDGYVTEFQARRNAS